MDMPPKKSDEVFVIHWSPQGADPTHPKRGTAKRLYIEHARPRRVARSKA